MGKRIGLVLVIVFIILALTLAMAGHYWQGVPDLIIGPQTAKASGSVMDSVQVDLISDMDIQGPFVSSGEQLIPWGNGFISFSILQSKGNDSVPMNAVVATVSYYSKYGKTAEEVQGWNVIVNECEEQPVYCEQWFTFPDGGQTNYTNTVFTVFVDGIQHVRLEPVLSDGLDVNDYPVLVGVIPE